MSEPTWRGADRSNSMHPAHNFEATRRQPTCSLDIQVAGWGAIQGFDAPILLYLPRAAMLRPELQVISRRLVEEARLSGYSDNGNRPAELWPWARAVVAVNYGIAEDEWKQLVQGGGKLVRALLAYARELQPR